MPFDTSFFREEINKKEVEFERKTSNCIKCKKLHGAKEMGVQFYTIDKTAFIEATQSLRDEFCAESADNARYYEDFLSYVQA